MRVFCYFSSVLEILVSSDGLAFSPKLTSNSTAKRHYGIVIIRPARKKDGIKHDRLQGCYIMFVAFQWADIVKESFLVDCTMYSLSLVPVSIPREPRILNHE